MNISKLTQTLLDPFDRLPDHPLKPAMRSAIIDVRAAAEGFGGHKIALQSDDRMTPKGRSQALRDSLVQNHGKAWARAKAPVAKARKEIQQRRDALVIKPVDKTDVAGELQRAEIRAWIRSLDQGVRQSVVASATDKRVLEAALSAPPQLSGIVDPKAAAEIENRYIELTYPKELAELEALDSVVAEAEAAVGIAYNELRQVCDMHAHDFDELMKPIETIRPWLMDDGKQVCEIGSDGKPSYRLATEVDREIGFKGSYDEYKAAQGLADAA
jgi:hypothetical protein